MADTTEQVHLFTPYTIRGCTFPNRLMVPPMCIFCSENGYVNDGHIGQYFKYADLGFGGIIIEATAIVPQGRISPADLGLWDDDHIEGFKRLAKLAHNLGRKIGIQLDHAGRKASPNPHGAIKGTDSEKTGKVEWQIEGPSAIAYDSNSDVPRELTHDDIKQIVKAFGDAAERAVKAGLDFIEIHGAHGFLIHEFLSPLSNQRTDEYGGSYENRTRLVKEVADEIRKRIPSTMPLFVRISATDYVQGGWDVEQSKVLSKELCTEHGVDIIDISTAGLSADQVIPPNWDHQLYIAKDIRESAHIHNTCVGGICDGTVANKMITEGYADFVEIGRALFRDAFVPRHVAQDLNLPVPEYRAPIAWGTRVPRHSKY
ncbi:hypothetical protein WA158_005057 [Blastocystis sp. Blastoise]